MKKGIVAVMCLVLLGGWTVPLWAQHHWGKGGRFGGGGPGLLSPFLLRKLNLSDTQRASLQQIMDTHKANLQALFQQMRTAHQAIADKFYGPDAVAVEDFGAQTEQINTARQALLKEGLTVAIAIRNLLTPAQLAQAAQLQQQLKALHEQLHGLMKGTP
jgi:Spy/CpxP family protein refolding chaperone